MKNKKSRQAVLAITLGLALLLGSSTGALAITKTKLSVVGNISVTTQFKDLERPFWLEKIPALSDGAITASFKGWNEMGLKGPEIFRLLSRGVMHIASAQLGHHAGDAPINDATDLAGLSPTIGQFRKVTDAFRPVLTDFYEKKLGLKIFTMQSFQAQILYCRKKIGGLKDLKGVKVRSSGASQADFIKYFGGSAINMSFGEVQQALQNGVIDCAITGTLGGYSAKWYEGAKYLYTLPINWGAGATVANIKSWNKIAPDARKLIESNLAKLQEEMWDLNRKEGEIGINCNTSGPCPLGKPGGLIRVDASPADLELRREALLKSVLPNWAKRCGSDCAKQFNRTIGKITNLKAPVN